MWVISCAAVSSSTSWFVQQPQFHRNLIRLYQGQALLQPHWSSYRPPACPMGQPEQDARAQREKNPNRPVLLATPQMMRLRGRPAPNFLPSEKLHEVALLPQFFLRHLVLQLRT